MQSEQAIAKDRNLFKLKFPSDIPMCSCDKKI